MGEVGENKNLFCKVRDFGYNGFIKMQERTEVFFSCSDGAIKREMDGGLK